MKLQRVQNNNYNTNFSAHIIAQCDKIQICKLTSPQDIIFLKKFSERTDFKKLMPELSQRESNRWHQILKYAIGYAEYPLSTTYLTITDNKLCGIITCFQNKTTFINGICTIPTNIGQKVKFAGKTLFYQIFKDFIEHDGEQIELSAIVNGPYNVINKFKELGFKVTSDDIFNYVDMAVNKAAVITTMEKLKKIIQYKTLPNIEINLDDTIKN